MGLNAEKHSTERAYGMADTVTVYSVTMEFRRNNTISTKVTYINLTVCRRTSPIVACCSPCSECSMFTITTSFFLLVDSVIAREVFGLRASLLSNAKITKHLSNLSNFNHNLWGWAGLGAGHTRNVAPSVAS